MWRLPKWWAGSKVTTSKGHKLISKDTVSPHTSFNESQNPPSPQRKWSELAVAALQGGATAQSEPPAVRDVPSRTASSWHGLYGTERRCCLITETQLKRRAALLEPAASSPMLMLLMLSSHTESWCPLRWGTAELLSHLLLLFCFLSQTYFLLSFL